VTQLRAAHARGETAAGLDVVKGEVGDMWALGIREAYKSKLQVHTNKNTPFVWPRWHHGDLCCMDV
jgi:chaperonin GroEL (HSP60 family)